MRVVGFPQFARTFDAIVDQVVADREPTLIFQRRQEAMVLVAAADWSIIAERIGLERDSGS